MKINYILVLGILIVSIISCRTDQTDLIEMPGNPGSEPEIFVNATFNGFITDTNGEPVTGARVEIGNTQQLTDERGYFKINDLVKGSGAIVKVNANGYLQSVATVLPSTTGLGHIRMNLSTASYQNIISPATDENISVNDEIALQIEPNSFNLNGGASYGDQILSHLEYFNVSEPSFHRLTHGDMLGVTLLNESVLIEPFTMMSFEAEGSAGEALELNSVVKASARVPDAKLDFAPSEIPVWYLFEPGGIWLQKGIAVLVDDHYQFDIDGLGRWSCGEFNDFVELSGQANEGEGITNVNIRITNQNQISDSKIIVSDDTGFYRAKVPTGTPLIIEVLDECNNVSGITEVGSLDADEIANISLHQTSVETLVLNGNLICDEDIVTTGYAMIRSSLGEIYAAEANSEGEFEIEILNCGATTYDVTGVNVGMNAIGTTLSYPTADLIQVKNLESCSDSAAYFVTFKFADRELTFKDLAVDGQTDFGNFVAVDIDFVHVSNGVPVNYRVTTIQTSEFEGFNYGIAFVDLSNSGTPDESYIIEGQGVHLVDLGPYMEGNAYNVNFTNKINNKMETGSIHFRIEKL